MSITNGHIDSVTRLCASVTDLIHFHPPSSALSLAGRKMLNRSGRYRSTFKAGEKYSGQIFLWRARPTSNKLKTYGRGGREILLLCYSRHTPEGNHRSRLTHLTPGQHKRGKHMGRFLLAIRLTLKAAITLGHSAAMPVTPPAGRRPSSDGTFLRPSCRSTWQ